MSSQHPKTCFLFGVDRHDPRSVERQWKTIKIINNMQIFIPTKTQTNLIQISSHTCLHSLQSSYKWACSGFQASKSVHLKFLTLSVILIFKINTYILTFYFMRNDCPLSQDSIGYCIVCHLLLLYSCLVCCKIFTIKILHNAHNLEIQRFQEPETETSVLWCSTIDCMCSTTVKAWLSKRCCSNSAPSSVQKEHTDKYYHFSSLSQSMITERELLIVLIILRIMAQPSQLKSALQFTHMYAHVKCARLLAWGVN